MRGPRNRRWRWAAAALFLAAVAVLVTWFAGDRAPVAPGSPIPANVLLITVDTLRPDALGWVAGRNETPHLDALAAEGFRFPSAVAPVPLTLPSHASMMTGLLPRRHGVRDNGQVFPGGIPILAELLAGRGYATAAVVSGAPLESVYGLDRGFAHYDEAMREIPEGWRERPAEETTRAALAWLSGAPTPWFLWVHYYDPHDPYTPPEGFRRPGPRGAYDGEVAYVDHSIGALLDGARRHPGPTLTLFTADHGESLGEHGEATHGFFVYDAAMLVPLVLHFPDVVAPGESGEGARLVDLLPTTLDLLGLPALPGLDGVSLRPWLEGEEGALPGAYLETLQPWISYGWAPLRAVRHQGWKLIAAPRPELYHLEADPGESRNLVDLERARARELQGLLRGFESAPEAFASAVEDTAALERLRALGYLGAPTFGPPPATGLADPKERLELRDLLGEADLLARRGESRRALALFDRALAVEPDNRFALSRSGVALLRAGEAAAAAARLERALAAGPLQAEMVLALAEALSRAGRDQEALPHWLEGARLQPRSAAVWSNLGGTLGRLGRAAEAVEALARAAELEPHDHRRRLRLAFARHAAGDLAGAARDLVTVAEEGALEPFPHAGALGLILAELGDLPAARRWLEASLPTEPEHAEARYRLAEIELAAGREAEARRALRAALAADRGLAARAAADPGLARILD